MAGFSPSAILAGKTNYTTEDAQLPSMQALQPLAPPPSPGYTAYTQPSGASGTFEAQPNVVTNQYSTTPVTNAAQDWAKQTGLPASMYPAQAPQTNGGTVVSGQGSLSQDAYERQQQSQLGATLQAAAERRRLGYLSEVTGQQSPQVGPQGGPAFDENAARSAAFARAKEEAGRTGIASLKALQDVMASRGLTGSSVEGNGIADVIGGAAGRVNDFTRTALTTDLNRAANIADRNQQNAITQRGQNLALMPSLMGLITAGNGVY